MKMTALLGRILMVGVILSSQTAIAQPFTPQATSYPATGTINDINVSSVKAWYNAFLKKDWNSLQECLADGFTFSSPLDDHINLAKFKERCWPNAYNIKKVDVDRIVINGDNVIVIANGYNNDGKLFRNCDCFKLKDGKIAAYECFFGPGINYPDSGK